MVFVNDVQWKPGMSVADLVHQFQHLGFQSIEVHRAASIIQKMKQEESQIYLTFTSNMVTSGLRGLFAQLVRLGMVDCIVTTAGGIEEDIMKATGEQFVIGSYTENDAGLYEQGMNRVGNLQISNESYEHFEQFMLPLLQNIYAKQKRLTVNELLKEIGLQLDDENSFLFQAAKKDIPIFCPAITDGAIGFHLFMFQQKHPDFIVDIVQDFRQLLGVSSHDKKKGLIALGGGISKHYAILGTLLNGGCDYAVYLTTARSHSGSMSGASTKEAISWGKVKDGADAATVIGEVSVTFPLTIMAALEELYDEKTITYS